jgi:hypothetical protein
MPAETGWFAAGKKERGLPSELADGGRPLIWLFIGGPDAMRTHDLPLREHLFRCGHHCSLRRKPGDITLTCMGLLVYGLRLNGD